MPTFSTSFLGLCIIFTLFSCTPVLNYTSFDNVQRVPNKGDIGVYTTVKSIPFSFKEIGLISIKGGENHSPTSIIMMAKEKARELGADGIILISQNTYNDGYYTNENISMPYTRSNTQFSAIIKEK